MEFSLTVIYNCKVLFLKGLFHIKTDRDSELTKADEYEKLGCKVFYCDPMESRQKPHVERTHVLFRYICRELLQHAHFPKSIVFIFWEMSLWKCKEKSDS